MITDKLIATVLTFYGTAWTVAEAAIGIGRFQAALEAWAHTIQSYM